LFYSRNRILFGYNCYNDHVLKEFAMQWTKNFLPPFVTILEARGKVDWLNPIRLANRYEDKKLILLGLLEPDGAKWRYERFKVSLKLPSSERTGTMEALWGMGPKDEAENHTVVYYATII
jgi:hypothetical protein